MRIAVHVGSTNPIEKILPVLRRSKTNHDPCALSIVSPIYMGHEKAIRMQKKTDVSQQETTRIKQSGEKKSHGKVKMKKVHENTFVFFST